MKPEIKREYRDNGQIYREAYYSNGKLHNENGPAYRCWDKTGQIWYEEYCLNGKCHNEKGPAYKSWYDNGKLCFEEYWLNGKYYTEREYYQELFQRRLITKQEAFVNCL